MMMHGVSFSNLPLNLQALVLKELEKLPMTVTDLAQVLCTDKGQISNICPSALFEDDGTPRAEAVTKDDREHSQWYDRNTMWLGNK